ncbi:hypothetical protein LR48_Vigan07g148600 [Vigna angularis]|uniref:Uncharacterized protein n=1 Tax=Phaseolus angularis TaxID=3914 RepID=A0A0L9UYW4_PHAAN|nr:hypothetical protein LR48_Vigan07g148600 [Vigna angularis]
MGRHPSEPAEGFVTPPSFDDGPLKTEDEIAAAYEELYGPTFSGVFVLGNDVFETDALVKEGSSCRRRRRSEVVAVVQKSASNARRNIVKVPMAKYSTFPHRYTLSFCLECYSSFASLYLLELETKIKIEIEFQFASLVFIMFPLVGSSQEHQKITSSPSRTKEYKRSETMQNLDFYNLNRNLPRELTESAQAVY